MFCSYPGACGRSSMLMEDYLLLVVESLFLSVCSEVLFKLVGQCCLKIFSLDYYAIVSPLVEHIKNHGVWCL